MKKRYKVGSTWYVENDNIDVYDIQVCGEYWATVQIPFTTPADKVDAVLKSRAYTVYPTLHRYPEGKVTYKLVNSIPPDGYVKEVEKPSRHAKVFTPVKPAASRHCPEENVQPLIAVRALDGFIEEWADVYDFMRKFHMSTAKIIKTMECNRFILSKVYDKKKFYKQGARYVFFPEDIGQVRESGLLEKLYNPELTAEEIAYALSEETRHYEQQREKRRQEQRNLYRAITGNIP